MRHVRPKYQVFLSSTYRDLHEARAAVTWAVLTAGHIPSGMENFTAKDDRGWKTITRVIDQSDYYVLLMAGLYGSIDPDTGLSWTEKEYDYARAKGLRVLSFVRERSSTPGDQVETDPVAVVKLAAFLKKVRDNHLTAGWKDGDDLPGKVTEALRHQIEEDEDEGAARPGWYRGDRVPSAAALDEFARLSEESAGLREENARLKAALGALEGGVYARLKALLDGGRDRVWIDNELRVSQEGPLPPASPQTGHGQVALLTTTDLHVQIHELPRGSSRMEGAVEIRNRLPPSVLVLPLDEITSARPAAHQPDMLQIRLTRSPLMVNGVWTL